MWLYIDSSTRLHSTSANLTRVSFCATEISSSAAPCDMQRDLGCCVSVLPLLAPTPLYLPCDSSRPLLHSVTMVLSLSRVIALLLNMIVAYLRVWLDLVPSTCVPGLSRGLPSRVTRSGSLCLCAWVIPWLHVLRVIGSWSLLSLSVALSCGFLRMVSARGPFLLVSLLWTLLAWMWLCVLACMTVYYIVWL